MLFQITNLWQILGWCLVFAGLIIMNEIGRRTKAGGMLIFVIIPTVLTVYFILAHLGMFGGSANPTVAYMDGWFHYFKRTNGASARKNGSNGSRGSSLQPTS